MKTLSFVVSIVVALSSISQADPERQPFSTGVPSVLKITYDHDMWGVVTLEMRGGKLIYECQGIGGNKTFAMQPNLDQWAKFFEEINTARTYKWSDHYSGPLGALDGGFHWALDLQINDITFHSDGSSAFPLDGDLTEAQRGTSKHKSYDLFMEAVSHLIGQGFPSER